MAEYLDLDDVAADNPKAIKELEQMRKEIKLLRNVHWAARRVMRYNGVDRKKTLEAAEELKEAVWGVNDFDLLESE